VAYRIQVERDLCSGLRACVDVDPVSFALGGDGIAVPRADATDSGDVIEAARACPMGAIRVFDGAGKQLV